MLQSLSLDDRRPTGLSQLIGNPHILGRLVPQIQKGLLPRRALFHGPSGAGKTTIATILGRLFFCTVARQGLPAAIDPCGRCAACRTDLDGLWDFTLWTGMQLREPPRRSRTFAGCSGIASQFVLIDEVQDLTDPLQALFQTDLEKARATVVFTTTDLSQLRPALVNRFTDHLYELRRPEVAEAVAGMAALCERLGVRATSDQLHRVARHHNCDLRKCLDFPYLVVEQTPDGLLTH